MADTAPAPSSHFSQAFADAPSRQRCVQATLGVIAKYDFDGVEFDWEYPDRVGKPTNEHGPDDFSHFLEFLQLFREQASPSVILSLAVPDTPYAEKHEDLCELSKVLDYVSIMNYDLGGCERSSSLR